MGLDLVHVQNVICIICNVGSAKDSHDGNYKASAWTCIEYNVNACSIYPDGY